MITPGPWQKTVTKDGFIISARHEGGQLNRWIAELVFCMYNDHKDCISDANLISAAPDLMESLEKIVTTICANCGECNPPDDMTGCEDIIAAKQAIDKAKGNV